MPSSALPDRTVVTVAGPDAEHLLQNIVTTDLDALAPGEARPGALLSPQGKILFDFLISRDGADGFRLDVRRDAADDLVRRLTLYRLRAKAEISKQDQIVVSAVWENDSGGSENDSSLIRDMRFRTMPVYRSYGAAPEPEGSPYGWTALRIANGIAESGEDYAPGDAFPHDALLDQMDGVGFRKGCYVGQEVVSRMQHRGTARRRVLIAESAQDLPPSGAELRAGGKPLGRLGSAQGRHGLAIVRIDKVKQAMDAGERILADGVEVALSIPGWAAFSFPEDAEEA